MSSQVERIEVLISVQTTGVLNYDYDGNRCPNQAIPQGCVTVPTTTSTASISKANTATIAVGTSLGVVAVILAGVGAYILLSRRSAATKQGVALESPPPSANFLRDQVPYPDLRYTHTPTQDYTNYNVSNANPHVAASYPQLPMV